MSDPFLAEIRMFGFDFAPRGWAFLDGTMLPIDQNQSLFKLLGTAYGGDGQNNFALPDLRGRTPMHVGNGLARGERAGIENVTLTTPEIPAHIHMAFASTQTGNKSQPEGNILAAEAAPDMAYGTYADTSLQAGTVGQTGSGMAHSNMQPFQTVNFCIAIQGIFPPHE
ncbi:phage tail protein [Mesobaculum littorinae]|uniref:Phage tail protein n=1 Tax=Mesobaculum littorinae TaxID=2486419 RepID=A0A438AE49_9RHOB|nr:tail fiber protein [Mesobaculum littorinae]RVV96980.1 phage tail protein [Mesobaculum littorinae]